jgi:exopolysaccharide biosynthesis predicted pyruvyltransferase EpsI
MRQPSLDRKRTKLNHQIAGMTTHDESTLRQLQSETLAILKDVLTDAPASAAVLDYPRHQNAGDTLIWQGEMNYLARLGIKPAYIADIGRTNFDELDRRVPEGPILLHGGGNFGDLWPAFQESREHVVQANPNRQIVCLPQTVRFSSAERAKLTNDIFAAHGQVTVLVRDHRSLEHARSLMPDVDFRFCFDAALGNEPLRRTSTPTVETVILARQDLEASAVNLPHIPNSRVIDWNLTRVDQVMWALNRVPLATYKRLPSSGKRLIQPLVDKRYESFTRIGLRNAVRAISSGERLVTDRLHAHVLAVLLGIPHIVFENSYGKIRPIFDEYTGRFSTARFAAAGSTDLVGMFAEATNE